MGCEVAHPNPQLGRPALVAAAGAGHDRISDCGGAMTGTNIDRPRMAGLVGMLGVVSLLFFPFAGFTERTAYVPSPIFRDYGLTGIGTYGQDFNLFGYPAGVGFVQLLMLALAVVLGYAAWRCFRLGGETGAAATKQPARIGFGVAGGAVLLVVVALVAVFPSVEEQTIWVTESNGWIETWWVAYGAFVSPLAAAGMGLLLRSAPETAAAPPAPPPSE